MNTEAAKYGYAESSWENLSEFDRQLLREIRPMPRATYSVNHSLARLEQTLEGYEKDTNEMNGTFNLNPDFQRGHVWTREQQVAYVENVFRGIAPMLFKFNAPSFGSITGGDIPPGDFVCVDGLQRLTALREFLAGKFKVFGAYDHDSLKGTPFDSRRLNLTCVFEIFTFTHRADLLQFYLDLNSGGTVHAPEEIERVKQLRDQALGGDTTATTKAKSASRNRRKPT